MNKKKIVVFENIINENVKDVYENLKVQKLHMCKVKWNLKWEFDYNVTTFNSKLVSINEYIDDIVVLHAYMQFSPWPSQVSNQQWLKFKVSHLNLNQIEKWVTI